MNDLYITKRIKNLKDDIFQEPRYVSIEQALIITRTYQENEDKPVMLKRALSLKHALEELKIQVRPEELIVGNRSAGTRSGIVFPESGSTWVDREYENLPFRNQDRFLVHEEDITAFREKIVPYWKGKSLEDVIDQRYGNQIRQMKKIVKINQTDHAQGHICPNCSQWLKLGPSGLYREALKKRQTAQGDKALFYESVVLTMQGVITFIKRYRDLCREKAKEYPQYQADLLEAAQICGHLSEQPAHTFQEAVQSIWFLFVVLHMESNASSFSPGRLDQILYPYYQEDMVKGRIDHQKALEMIEALWIKFNEIVYMRNEHSAKYFAGFPIGFNIVLGGQDETGNDYCNDLSFLFLKAQEHLLMPQPNLSVRLSKKTNDQLLKEAVRVVSKGSGMPQFFNDEAVIPALQSLGIEQDDARNYAVVGCVELTTQGDNLGWSDAAMFNLNKLLEITLTGGVCLLNGEMIAKNLGCLRDYQTYGEMEAVYQTHLKHYVGEMVKACEEVEKAHMEILPSPFLSSVIDCCMEKGMDVTRGGAYYNYSGIQMIQVANLADSLAALKKLVFEDKRISKDDLLDALVNNYQGKEYIRKLLLNKAPKYGNDIDWVDELGVKWAEAFKKELSQYKNYRGGLYHTGMYTVSAHVPMGENVGASPDGRFSMDPLADGGMSPVYGRDVNGPTAVLKSVSKLDKVLTSNGGLLNMKFLPAFFANEEGIDKFADMLRAFVDLEIPHVQFNVVNKDDLVKAQKEPEKYKSLTVRVAGYTAYFTELAKKLQNEIIARTSYGDI